VVRDSIKAEGGVIAGSDIPVGEDVLSTVLFVDEDEEEDIGVVPGFVHPDKAINTHKIRVKVKYNSFCRILVLPARPDTIRCRSISKESL